VFSGAFGEEADAVVAQFSVAADGVPPSSWAITALRNRTPAEFRIVREGDIGVIQAHADASAGALVHALNINPAEYPILDWRWQIDNHIPESNMRTRAGDDFPARVYVTFTVDKNELSLGDRLRLQVARLFYGVDLPAAAICYVWDRELPIGTAMPNAYSSNVMMVVAESGGPTPSGWVNERHNLRADYERFFGGPAPAVSSVILAVDTDDTGAQATARFGDIRFMRGPTE